MMPNKGQAKTSPNQPDAVQNVREQMDVICSCGQKLGVVDHVEGDSIKLTKKDSPDDRHHFIPLDWVDHVDRHVHISKNSQEAMEQWQMWELA